VLQADKPEFLRHLSLLCAAYNVPLGDREAAYWAAFNKLQLSDWIRMTTAMLGPDGPEKLPTVAQLWRVRKALGKASQVPGRPGTQDVLTAMVETAVARWALTPAQLRMNWNWIAREPGGPECAILGVIIPQDPEDPVRYPAHRLMVADLEHPRVPA